MRLASERKDARMPDGPLPILRRYSYEVAQGNTPGQLAALMQMVTVSQVLFGTDYPYREGARGRRRPRTTRSSARPIRTRSTTAMR